MTRQRVQLTKQKVRRKREAAGEGAAADRRRAVKATRRAQSVAAVAARWLRNNP